MNKQSLKVEAEILEENAHLPTNNPDLNEKHIGFTKDKNLKGIGLLRTKSKSKIKITLGNSNYDECFSGGNFSSQYEDECPVNYSLKYSDTEPCKTVTKCESTKKNYKDYSDYAETDLDQPTNFSLKYAEKTCEEDKPGQTAACDYYNNHKVKFKGYADYVETDLDQPTDFTLKYRESADEDVKSVAAFGFYENEERKQSGGFGSRTTEAAPTERLPERYTSQNETPLMFSRSSSMNSLSSFVHITQSIPDDRSSVVSDFSRMTSGIISPSELPDSPTQTAPSSPKRQKSVFPTKPEFMAKKSVFEDDVATYKQEDTPMEFSRATSLSSLNLDKPERNIKDENQNTVDHLQSEHLKQQITPDKLEQDKGKFELASVLEVDESVFADCISIDIQINCRKPKQNCGRLVVAQENHNRQGFPVKPSFRLRFHNDRKGYSAYEGSDDAVHTYHTEGTPANVSHAGSHSDLSVLSVASGVPGVEDNSDNESFFPEESETRLKAESRKKFNRSDSVTKGVSYVNNQPRLDHLRKDHQLMAKDETATFATENSPCDISIRSSLSDLTVNVMDATLTINRTETCEEPPSQMLSPLRNVSPQSPNSIVYEEVEDPEKSLEEPQSEFITSDSIGQINDWEDSSESKGKKGEVTKKGTETNFDFDSDQPLTPFEEALVEECIRLGMPQRKSQPQETDFNLTEEGKSSEKSDRDGFTFDRRKKTSSDIRISGTGSSPLNAVSFDLDSSEPLTPFEEVLLEQCIRLGMPQKKNSKLDGADLKYVDGEMDNFDSDSTELITPLETALLEQCIRLGMPQRKSLRKEGADENSKPISCMTAHLNRLKLSGENEKDRKLESCPCGKKHSNKRRNINCNKKTRNRLVESCPV